MEQDKKSLIQIFIYIFMTIAVLITFFLIINDLNRFGRFIKTSINIVAPLLIGFSIAYVINKPYSYLRTKFKFNKTLSIVLSYLGFLTLLVLFFTLVIPQLINSVSSIASNLPGYITELTDALTKLSVKLGVSEQMVEIATKSSTQIVEYILKTLTSFLPKLTSLIGAIFTGFTDFFLSLILSIYMLIEKDKLIQGAHKFQRAIFKPKQSAFIEELFRRADKMFGGFLVGQLLDSSIVASINLVMMLIFDIPYAFLIAVIILFTNVIPFFGTTIGMVPSVILVLFVSVDKAIIYLIIALVIQQIDGNYIGPKILGDSLGISPFWVLFALLVFGNLFGFLGLLLGVPSFALFVSFFKDWIESKE